MASMIADRSLDTDFLMASTPRAFLLTPNVSAVPEPSGFVLLSFGSIFLLALSYRRWMLWSQGGWLPGRVGRAQCNI